MTDYNRRKDDKPDPLLIRVLCFSVLFVVVLIVALFFMIRPAHAQPVCVSADCGHGHHGNDYSLSINRDRDNTAAGVLLGAVVTCGIISAIRGKWCWQIDKQPTVAKPDPQPLNVAPQKQSEVFTVRPAQ
jgi:hypothetical protein